MPILKPMAAMQNHDLDQQHSSARSRRNAKSSPGNMVTQSILIWKELTITLNIYQNLPVFAKRLSLSGDLSLNILVKFL